MNSCKFGKTLRQSGPICGALTLFVSLLLGCATSSIKKNDFQFPSSAASHDELLKGIPQNYQAGDISGNARLDSQSPLEFIEFLFLKNEPLDRIPMRVGIYQKNGDKLTLVYWAPLPTPSNGCQLGECSAKIFGMPMGFQLSINSKNEDHARVDYKFLWAKDDLRLMTKSLGVGTEPLIRDDIAPLCSRYYSFYLPFSKNQIPQRRDSFNGLSKTEPLSKDQLAPVFLKRDHLSFDVATSATICDSDLKAQREGEFKKQIEKEASGAGYSILETKRVGAIQASSLYFYDKKGNTQRATLKISGQLGGTRVSEEIDAKELPLSKTCDSPCSELKDDEARRSLICNGSCSYGAPIFLTADDASHMIFVAVGNQAGRNAAYSVYAYQPGNKKVQTIGSFIAQSVKEAHYNISSKKLALSLSSIPEEQSTEEIAFPQ